jgi:hypothetical protein
MSEYSQGVCEDGAAILKDGLPMTIEQILNELRSAQRPSAVVPEGYSLVPSTMVLNYESFELIKMTTGDGETEDDFSECTLWVGELVDDDGEPDAYGLNIACSECMEEGSITVVEFPRPTTSTIPKLS